MDSYFYQILLLACCIETVSHRMSDIIFWFYQHLSTRGSSHKKWCVLPFKNVLILMSFQSRSRMAYAEETSPSEQRLTRVRQLQEKFLDTVLREQKGIEAVLNEVKLLKRRTNSNKTSFQKTATAILIGLTIICSIGFFVKLIHISINNIIFGW